jgi:hypothetical protein
MPATDILNPTPVWQENIQDSMCPNYGFTRKRTSTQLKKKAIGGTPWTRETANTGHTLVLSWIGRSWACVQLLKQYYEQYEDGFFTIIDWDGGGRHYVGRFTSEVSPIETGNDLYDVQNVTFEEMPQVTMVKYPSDWNNDAIVLGPYNDFGDQKLATFAAPTPVAHAVEAWHGVDMPTQLADLGTANTQWGCYEYRGYGFKLFLVKGPAQGQCSISLDGTVIEATVDCYAAGAAGPQCVCTEQNVPLDIHRVQVNVLGTKNEASTSADITWAWLQVMR